MRLAQGIPDVARCLHRLGAQTGGGPPSCSQQQGDEQQPHRSPLYWNHAAQWDKFSRFEDFRKHRPDTLADICWRDKDGVNRRKRKRAEAVVEEESDVSARRAVPRVITASDSADESHTPRTNRPSPSRRSILPTDASSLLSS